MPEPAVLMALRQLAPPGAGCGWADPRLGHPAMTGEVLPGAIDRRQREFGAGRAAARAAMAEIGKPPAAIPHGADRAPIWPAGIIGSITHTASECLAIVMPAPDRGGIGLDLEEDTPLPPDLWPAVLTPEEISSLAPLPLCRKGRMAKLYFLAKEAAYKAQYPLTGRLLEFHDMRIAFASDGFQARVLGQAGTILESRPISGRIARAGGHLLALAVARMAPN